MADLVRSKLIEAGIKNLKDFGYPAVTADDILTDAIYSAFFRSMLVDNKGRGYDSHINPLIEAIDANSKVDAPKKSKKATKA